MLDPSGWMKKPYHCVQDSGRSSSNDGSSSSSNSSGSEGKSAAKLTMAAAAVINSTLLTPMFVGLFLSHLSSCHT